MSQLKKLILTAICVAAVLLICKLTGFTASPADYNTPAVPIAVGMKGDNRV